MLFLIIYTMYKRIKVGFLKKEFLRKIKENDGSFVIKENLKKQGIF